MLQIASMKGGDSIEKKYVYSAKETKTLMAQGYTLWAMLYFVNGSGSTLYIMAK